MVGVTQGCEVEPGAGEEAVEEARPVLHPFQPGLHRAASWLMLRSARVAKGPLQVRLHRFDLG